MLIYKYISIILQYLDTFYEEKIYILLCILVFTQNVNIIDIDIVFLKKLFFILNYV